MGRAGGGVAVMEGRGRELDRSGGERALTVGAPAPDHPTRAVPLGTTLRASRDSGPGSDQHSVADRQVSGIKEEGGSA